MSGEQLRSLLSRAATVAVELEALSETRASSLEARVSGSKERALPVAVPSDYDRFLERLERTIEGAEGTLRRRKKRQIKPETNEQRDYGWLMKYAGWTYPTAADHAGVDPKEMYAFYVNRAKWDPWTGKPKR